MSTDRWASAIITGDSEEAVLAKNESRSDQIRRPGRKIDVMSDEEYNERQAEYKAKMDAWREELRKKSEAETDRYNAGVAAIDARIAPVKRYPSEIKEKLSLYHEPADDSKLTEKEWQPIYAAAAPFLAKCVVAYRYGIDKQQGYLAGADLNYYGGDDLVTYLQARNLPADGDEKALNRLVDLKLSWPQFFLAALGAQLDRFPKDSPENDLIEFIMSDSVTQTEITELITTT